MSRVTKDNHTSSQGNKKIGHTKETEHGGARQPGPLHLVSRAVSVVAILVGSSVLVGWTLDVDVLKRILPGLVAMNPTTAITFALAGASLWLLQARNRASGLDRIARGLAFAVALVGLIKLVGILSGWDVGIDQLLFRGRLESEAAVTGIPNRMAPNTALNFFLLGGALLLVDRQNHRSYWLAQLLIVVSLAASLLAIVGYAYGVTSFYGVASFIPMALHTALTFVVLSVGLLCVRPDHGLMAIVTSDSVGGVLVRRLLPAAILVQIALGWLRLVGQQAGLYGMELGVALMVVSSTVILTVLIAWSAGLLNRSDTGRKRAEEQLRRSYEELDVRVQERTAELAEANAHLRAGIAERERFEVALKESEAHKTAVMQAALDCIITMDHAGLITDFNPAAEQTFGYRRAEVLGRGLAETIIPPSLRDAHRRGLARYLATGEGPVLNRRIEVPGMRADGTEFPVELAIVPMRLGEQPMFVGYLRDITERKRNEETLRESEERFRLLVEGVEDYAIFMLDPEGRVTSWNAGAERNKGYKAAEIIGEHFSIFYTEGDLERGHPAEELRVAAKEGSYEEEGWRVRKDGSTFWANVLITALRDEEGNLRGFAKVVRDTTERKKAEEELQRSESNLRTAQRIARLGSWEYVLDEDAAQWSDELYRIFGFTPQEFVPRYETFFEHVYADDRRSVRKEALRALRGAGSSEIDYRVVRMDGEVRSVHTEYEVVRDRSGRSIKMVGTVQDVTERKRVEEALRTQNEYLASLHETTLGLLERLDPADLLTGILERSAALVGTPHGFVYLADPETGELEMRAGAGLFARHKGQRISPHEGLSGRVFQQGEPVVVDDYDAWEGKLETFSDAVQAAAGAPLRLGGRVAGALGVAYVEPERTFSEQETEVLTRFANLASVALDNAYLHDSARRELAAREQAEKELAALVDELRRSNTELEQFAYVASHDLQEPLRMVSSYTQLLARRYRGQLDDDADEFISYAVDGATRMQTLINDLLAYSRVGTQRRELVPTDTGDVFEAALANLRSAIEESGAEVIPGELPTVMGDGTQLAQLFQNLISNAIKFRGETPVRVHVGAERRDGQWLFSVRDNGIGIEPEYAERIFVIFQRLHARADYSGTGIGLAVCKKIVERHGGRIWVESEPGKGSTFYFTLRPKETLPDHV